MSGQSIFEALDQARTGLQDCLREMEAAAPADPNVGRSFSVVQEAFEQLGDISELRERVPAEDVERLESALREILQLNAVLAAIVQEDRLRVLGAIEASRTGLRTMNAISKNGPESSSTCDVSA